MKLTDAHREQIRALVDAVSDPTATDIVFAVSTRPESRRGRRVVTGVVVVVVAALIAIGVVFATRGGDSVTHHTSVLSVTPTVPTSCVVDASGNGGCEMRPAKARRFLAFRARVPKGVPAGWIVERKQLRVYRNPLPASEGGGMLPNGAQSLAVYNQVWTPPGTDLDVIGTCPTLLQVRERPAWPGEERVVGLPTIDLGQGTVVYGRIAEPGSCGSGGILGTLVVWVRDGVSFTVSATNVDRDQMVAVVESLSRS